MSEKSRYEFDFSSFANSLATAPWGMLEKVEEEIKNISNVTVEDPMRRFRQTAYLRKLERLKCFAETGELPTYPIGRLDLSSEWREYYQPPLYYLLLAPIYSAADAAGLSEETSVRLLRTASVAPRLAKTSAPVTMLETTQGCTRPPYSNRTRGSARE